MLNDFTLSAYGDLLEAIVAGGYRVRGFTDGEPRAGDLLLRHDVDLSLEAALRMAEFEHDHGIASTYLVMSRSVFYNLAAPASTEIVERIRALGHHVGHHPIYPDPDPAVAFTCEPVMAWHNPEPAYMTAPVPGWTNAMEPCWTGPLGGDDPPPHYRSDSNHRWRHGSPREAIATGAFEWLQLLIHPVLWVCAGDNLRMTIDEFLDQDREHRFEHLRRDRLDLG